MTTDPLVDNVAENRQLEYKLGLPSNSRDDRIEFLADVVAFANSSGGLLLFGVDERRNANGNATGIPKEICGLPGINTDEEIRRFESIIRDGIDPRILGIRTRPIPLVNGNTVIALEVPRSWNVPHAVDYQGHWRFYYRDSAGKHPMDVTEVRSLFNLSEELSERVRNFRADRLLKIGAGEIAVQLEEGAKLVLHLIPLESFTPGRIIDISADESMVADFGTISTEEGLPRYNLDGLLISFSTNVQAPNVCAYTQVFRNGIIEAGDMFMLSNKLEDGTSYIPSSGLARVLIKALGRYLHGLDNLGIRPPLLGYISLLGVRGYLLARKRDIFPPVKSPHPIDRDTLELPELFIEDFTVTPETILKPAFDALWNAVGWPRCTYYDGNGQWQPT